MHNYVIRYIIFCFYSIIFPIFTIFREIFSYEICKLFTNVHITYCKRISSKPLKV